MEACEVTLLVPLLLALRGSVTECLVISCDLTEGYCCSFPSLEGLVHFVARINLPQTETADLMLTVMPAYLFLTDVGTSMIGCSTCFHHGSHHQPPLQTSSLKHQTCCLSPHEFSCPADPRWLSIQHGGCWGSNLYPLTRPPP